jgi:hypothetical protein
MIKLSSLLESTGAGPHPKLAQYLLKHRTDTFSGTLFHGTPLYGLKQMLVNGIYGTEHGELSEDNTFSTSLNDEVLTMFSEGDGTTGLEFEVKDIKVLILDDLIAHFAIAARGSGMEVDVDEVKAAKFAKAFKLPLDRFSNEPIFPYNYLSSLGVDAVAYDYVWKRIQRGRGSFDRDESEICFLGHGIKKLNHFIADIYVNGHGFMDKAEALQAIGDPENRYD